MLFLAVHLINVSGIVKYKKKEGAVIKFKTKALFIFLVFVFCICSIFTYAHPGRTDSNGGHWNRTTGEYHYHTGEYAGRSNYNSSLSDYDSYSYTKHDDSPAAKFGTVLLGIILGLFSIFGAMFVFSTVFDIIVWIKELILKKR